MENLISLWATNTIERAPELFVIGLVAWFLRKDLKECMASNKLTLERLLKKVIGE